MSVSLLRGVQLPVDPPKFAPALLATWGWTPFRESTLTAAEADAVAADAGLLVELTHSAAEATAQALDMAIVALEHEVTLLPAAADGVCQVPQLQMRLTLDGLYAATGDYESTLAFMRVYMPDSGMATIGEIKAGRATLR